VARPKSGDDEARRRPCNLRDRDERTSYRCLRRQAVRLECAARNVAFASTRGPNAADHDIAAQVQQDADPQSITVVTSDRDLASRVTTAGGRVEGAGQFRRRLDALAR
jgi:hypothetical protein